MKDVEGLTRRDAWRIGLMVLTIAIGAIVLAHCTAQRTMNRIPRSDGPAPLIETDAPTDTP